MNKILFVFITLLCTLVQRAVAQNNPILWDFETEDQLNDWSFVDLDGDGYNWMYFNNTDYPIDRIQAYSGEGLMISHSFYKEGRIPLTPDNWLISPEVTLGGTLSFWAAAQDEDYSDEIFSVFVCVEGKTNGEGCVKVGDDYFIQVGKDITATADFTEYSFGLAQFQGDRGRFAIRHYKTYDKFIFKIDDVKLDINEEFIPFPTTPENLTATPGATTADVVWTDNDDTAWNLRYRLINPNEMKYFLWDFETDESRENWEIYDLDGDGNNWYAAARYDIAHGGSILFMSNSYDSNTSDPLDPDNWLISPQVPLDGTLSVWAASYHNSDLDNFAVYVLNGSYDSGNFNVNDWVKVGEDHQPTCFDVNEGGWKQYTFDLSEFAGNTGHFAIRHYNSSNNWRLMIDDVSLTVPGDPPAEWNVVEGINTTNYTILGLTPGENYEVQVQAYNRKGTSDWTKSFFFSTENGAIDVTLHDNEDNSNVITAFNEQFVNVSISGRKLYKDGGWNTLCLPFDFYIDGSVLENANIKVLNGENSYFDNTTGTLTLNFTDYNEPVYNAGTTCIVKWDVESPSEIEDPEFSGVVIKDIEPVASSSSDNSVSFIGHFSPFTVSGDNTVLYIGSNNILYKVDNNLTFGACRAYFQLNNGLVAGDDTSASQQSSVRAFVINFGENETTGIVNIEADPSLSTLHSSSEWYTLDGRRLSGKPIQRGIYINNGKKVVIK